MVVIAMLNNINNDNKIIRKPIKPISMLREDNKIL